MTAAFKQVVGTGGIGSGIVFEFAENRPLSRNETRLASLSPARDYCKQHIILHYIARILSPELAVCAVGAVGRDAAGDQLLSQMREAGIDVSFVRQTDRKPTMFSVCLQYPDKAICNVTTAQSAGSLLSPEDIHRALAGLPRPVDAGTIAIAAPEVPVPARLALLKEAHAAGAFCVSSFLVEEVDEFVRGDGIENSDLIAVNEDEAAAYCRTDTDSLKALAEQCYAKLRETRPDIRLVLTCGAEGSFAGADGRLRRLPAKPAKVAATGGAGDAFIAGTVCGMALGLPFMDETRMTAAELGACLAAEAISVPDTIAGHIDRAMALRFIEEGRRGEQHEPADYP